MIGLADTKGSKEVWACFEEFLIGLADIKEQLARQAACSASEFLIGVADIKEQCKVVAGRGSLLVCPSSSTLELLGLDTVIVSTCELPA